MSVVNFRIYRKKETLGIYVTFNSSCRLSECMGSELCCLSPKWHSSSRPGCDIMSVSSVQSLIYVWLFVIPWTVALQASLSITNSWSLLKLMSIQSSHPLSSPSPPTFNLSQHQGLFRWVSSSYQVAKVLVSASASALPMNIRTDFL